MAHKEKSFQVTFLGERFLSTRKPEGRAPQAVRSQRTRSLLDIILNSPRGSLTLEQVKRKVHFPNELAGSSGLFRNAIRLRYIERE